MKVHNINGIDSLRKWAHLFEIRQNVSEVLDIMDTTNLIDASHMEVSSPTPGTSQTGNKPTVKPFATPVGQFGETLEIFADDEDHEIRVLNKATRTDRDKDGNWLHDKGTVLIYSRGNDMYLAKSQMRADLLKDDLMDTLYDKFLIPRTAYCPSAEPSFHRMENTESYYIKRPNLLGYSPSNPNRLANAILHEVKFAETILSKNPHPNVAHYEGVQINEGLITGLVWKKYSTELCRHVDPGKRNKMGFKYTDSPNPLPDRVKFIKEIRAGLQHLHSLGYVHNDLNPRNIVIGHEGEAVIVDFRSVTSIGASLKGVQGTYPWYNDNWEVALPSNDLDILEDIEEYLSDSWPKRYKIPYEF